MQREVVVNKLLQLVTLAEQKGAALIAGQYPERRLSGQWPSVAVACLQARLVCSGMHAKLHGNTVIAAASFKIRNDD